jgi:hypothetical protein
MKQISLILISLCVARPGLDAGEPRVALPQMPPARVKLTGIAVLPPAKWALLEVQEYGQPAQQIALAEGSRRIALEVVEVDCLGRWVMVRQAGALLKLTIENPAAVPSIAAANVDAEHVPLPLLPPVGAGDP